MSAFPTHVQSFLARHAAIALQHLQQKSTPQAHRLVYHQAGRQLLSAFCLRIERVCPLYSTAQNIPFHRLILAYLVQNRPDLRLPPVDRPRSQELGFQRRTHHLTPHQNQLNCPSLLEACRLEYPIDRKFDQTIFRCEYHTVMYVRRLWHPLHVISYP